MGKELLKYGEEVQKTFDEEVRKIKERSEQYLDEYTAKVREETSKMSPKELWQDVFGPFKDGANDNADLDDMKPIF